METTPYLALQGEATLVILEGKSEIRCCPLSAKRQWTIGRPTENNNPDIPVRSRIVGRQHGEFNCIDGEWFYIDKGSINGTYHNGKKISNGLNGRVRPVLLNNGDVLRVDSDDLTEPDMRGVWIMFLTETVGGKWNITELNSLKSVYIGRNDECDIVINAPYISGKHAVITHKKDGFYVSDCKSKAGTWLNGEQVLSEERLQDKDCISICDRHFIFNGNGLIYNEFKVDTLQKQILLKADIETKKVKNTKGMGMIELIKDIHLEINKGKLVALLGGSGAGKSTLMDCLNGMDTSGVQGSIYFQGEDLIKNFPRLKFLIASVPQQATFHKALTVERELLNSAELRLPDDMEKKDIKRKVDKIIAQLGLEEQRRTQIAKCSGGEQRRVNIGMDLVADKLLYCLDEPDAGLDPKSKKELFTFLRTMAHDDGKTILVIIHDVSEIDLFDQIIMLAKKDNVGRLAFSGNPNDARRYFGCEICEAYDLLAKNPEKYVR